MTHPKEPRETPTLGDVVGSLGLGMFMVFVSAFGINLCGPWCHYEYQFAQDKTEGEGEVVGTKRQKVRLTGRGPKSITLKTMIVESEHGTLDIGTTDPLPVGSTVEYDYSPSLQSARLRGESMFWLTLLFTVLSVILGVFGLFPLIVGMILLYRYLFGFWRRV